MLGVAATVLLAASLAPAEARNVPSCEVVNRALTVDAGSFAVTYRRRGDEIVVTYFGGRIDCGRPTVHAIDRIRIFGGEFHLDLSGGDFAPGATPEGDGSSEIEFEVDLGLAGYFWLDFGAGPDHVSAGSSGSTLGLNLNADEEVGDPDMTFAPPGVDGFGAPDPRFGMGGGGDTFTSAGAPGFDGSFEAETSLRVDGGPGRDELLGGPSREAFLGGGGADRISSGGGADIVEVMGGGRDDVDCGSGRDFLVRDRRDSARRCEKRLPPQRG